MIFTPTFLRIILILPNYATALQTKLDFEMMSKFNVIEKMKAQGWEQNLEESAFSSTTVPGTPMQCKQEGRAELPAKQGLGFFINQTSSQL